jgi:hypothetical protein
MGDMPAVLAMKRAPRQLEESNDSSECTQAKLVGVSNRLSHQVSRSQHPLPSTLGSEPCDDYSVAMVDFDVDELMETLSTSTVVSDAVEAATSSPACLFSTPDSHNGGMFQSLFFESTEIRGEVPATEEKEDLSINKKRKLNPPSSKTEAHHDISEVEIRPCDQRFCVRPREVTQSFDSDDADDNSSDLPFAASRLATATEVSGAFNPCKEVAIALISKHGPLSALALALEVLDRTMFAASLSHPYI